MDVQAQLDGLILLVRGLLRANFGGIEALFVHNVGGCSASALARQLLMSSPSIIPRLLRDDPEGDGAVARCDVWELEPKTVASASCRRDQVEVCQLEHVVDIDVEFDVTRHHAVAVIEEIQPDRVIDPNRYVRECVDNVPRILRSCEDISFTSVNSNGSAVVIDNTNDSLLAIFQTGSRPIVSLGFERVDGIS